MKEQTIVVGVGIDKIPGDQPILLSVQVVNLGALKAGSGGLGGTGTGSAGSAASKLVIVESSRGRSFYDAIHKFLASSSRQITFAHDRIVIFGKELATSDISGMIDLMSRFYQFRMNNWIFVADKTAREVLAAQTDHESIPAIEINQMMIDLTRNTFIPPVTRNDFVFRLSGEGRASYAPLIEIETSGPNPAPRIRVEKTAIFKKNRMITVLNAEESQGLIWFTERQKGGVIVIPSTSKKI